MKISLHLRVFLLMLKKVFVMCALLNCSREVKFLVTGHECSVTTWQLPELSMMVETEAAELLIDKS